MQTIPFVDLVTQYQSIKSDVDDAMQRVLDDASFILGKTVDEFETQFAQFVGTKHCVGLSNGLEALRLALTVLEIGAGDEVIIPANTFIATALAVTAAGAKPVLVDCDATTFQIDPNLIKSAITPRTKAIMPVHLTGHPSDMDPILQIAQQYGLHVVEDAAQAQGTQYKQRECGSLAQIGCFSFYPGKNLGAFGDAGAVTTDDDRLAERIRRIRHYGQRVKYDHVEKGTNARLDTLQAAVLSVKLKHLRQWNQQRAEHATRYEELLSGVGDICTPICAPWATHIYHLYMIQTEERDALQKHLNANGVQTGIHYPIPIHLQVAYTDLGYKPGDFPVAERLAKRILSLPMYPELQDAQQDYVVEQIKAFFQ